MLRPEAQRLVQGLNENLLTRVLNFHHKPTHIKISFALNCRCSLTPPTRTYNGRRRDSTADLCGMTADWCAAPACCMMSRADVVIRHCVMRRPLYGHQNASIHGAVDIQVLAFRTGRQLAVVDLDESYAPKSSPTLFGETDLPNSLSALEDPRLFVHRGELFMLAFGVRFTGPWPGWKVSCTSRNLSACQHHQTRQQERAMRGPRVSACFKCDSCYRRRTYHWGCLSQQNLTSASQSGRRNWVPFIYNDSIHFIYSINPPVVFRIPADHAGGDMSGKDICTEFVSSGANATVRWRYGTMRGGTPAVYDTLARRVRHVRHDLGTQGHRNEGHGGRCAPIMTSLQVLVGGQSKLM